MSNNNGQYRKQSLDVLKSAFTKIYVATIEQTFDGCSSFSGAFRLLLLDLFEDENNRLKYNKSRDGTKNHDVDNEQLLSEMANMMREGKSYSDDADVYNRCNWVALSRHLPLQDLRTKLNQLAAERDAERVVADLLTKSTQKASERADMFHALSLSINGLVSVHFEKPHVSPCPLSDKS